MRPILLPSRLRAISLSLCLLGGQGWSQSVFPPGRVAFPVKAPTPVALGKLWTDVGLFYPFAGRMSRAAWEAEFFAEMNRSLDGTVPLSLLAAQTLGSLQDPGALVLEKDEGRGEYFLPVLYEVMPDGSLWVVGGAREAVSKRMGPVTHINGEPLSVFLARRTGGNPGPDQVASVLSFAGQQAKAFTWTFTFGDGTSRDITATKDLPKDIWVEGGWDGVPLQLLPGLSAQELAAVRRLDLRIAAWLNGGASDLSSKLGPIWDKLRLQARFTPVFQISRQNTGYTDGSPSSVYSSKVMHEAVPFVQHPKADASFTARWPQGGCVPLGLSRALAGWALPPEVHAVASRARYALETVDILLPTAVYGAGASYGSSAFPGSTRGELPALGFDQSRRLHRGAAKALAAATILNFDQLFGFTPEPFQAPLAAGVLSLVKDAADVPDLIMQMARFNHEPHSHVRQSNGGSRTDAEEKTRHPGTPIPRFLPFRTISPDPGTLIVIAPTPAAKQGLPIRAGARITAIEGIPIGQWLKRASNINPARPDDLMRAGFELNYCLPIKDSLTVEFVNPGEAAQVQAIATCNPKEYTELPLPQHHAPLPPGWTLLNKPEQLSTDEMIRRAEAGENFLVDMRVPDVLADPDTRLAISDWGYFIRTPSEPAPWGSAAVANPMRAVRLRVGNPELPPPILKGKIVLLVWGENQSSMETQPMLLKSGLGMTSHTFLVGLPTAGVTGPITTLKLPLGEEAGFAFYTPTGAWPVFRSRAIQYRGIPLDLEVTTAALLRRSKTGDSQDLLLDCAIEALKELPPTSIPW